MRKQMGAGLQTYQSNRHSSISDKLFLHLHTMQMLVPDFNEYNERVNFLHFLLQSR